MWSQHGSEWKNSEFFFSPIDRSRQSWMLHLDLNTWWGPKYRKKFSGVFSWWCYTVCYYCTCAHRVGFLGKQFLNSQSYALLRDNNCDMNEKGHKCSCLQKWLSRKKKSFLTIKHSGTTYLCQCYTILLIYFNRKDLHQISQWKTLIKEWQPLFLKNTLA